ncbi:hypothetical protein GCM10018955_35350 [Planomonospora venezuelensis]
MAPKGMIPPPENSTSARSPLTSRSAGAHACSASTSFSVPVTFFVAVSTTRSTPRFTVITRLPSVFTRSGSSTPASWVFVVECSGAPACFPLAASALGALSMALRYMRSGLPSPHGPTCLAVAARSPASMSSQPL